MDNQQQDLEKRLNTHLENTTDLWDLMQNTLLQTEAHVLKAYGIDGQFVIGDEELYTWKDGVLDTHVEERVLLAKLDFINWEVQYMGLTINVPSEKGEEPLKVKCLQVTQIVNGGAVPIVYRISQLANSLLKPSHMEG
jgi:hypothetical protein